MTKTSSTCDGEMILDIALDTLRPLARNVRTHSKKQIRQIAESIRTFRSTNPVLIDESSSILAGHSRVAGAKLLGWSTVPCRLISTIDATVAKVERTIDPIPKGARREE